MEIESIYEIQRKKNIELRKKEFLSRNLDKNPLLKSHGDIASSSKKKAKKDSPKSPKIKKNPTRFVPKRGLVAKNTNTSLAVGFYYFFKLILSKID